MKKFALAASVLISFAAPAVAETASDPFVSTQGSFLGAAAMPAIIAGITMMVVVAASDGT